MLQGHFQHTILELITVHTDRLSRVMPTMAHQNMRNPDALEPVGTFGGAITGSLTQAGSWNVVVFMHRLQVWRQTFAQKPGKT